MRVCARTHGACRQGLVTVGTKQEAIAGEIDVEEASKGLPGPYFLNIVRTQEYVLACPFGPCCCCSFFFLALAFAASHGALLLSLARRSAKCQI
jgi:hypothetical protein